MTNQEATTKLTNIMHDDHYAWHPSILAAFGMAVDALKGAEGDCISRAGAIKAVHDEFDGCLVWDESGERTADEVEQILEEVPSAHPTHNNTSNALKSLDCIDRQDAIDEGDSK